jgi:hypothetical protein
MPKLHINGPSIISLTNTIGGAGGTPPWASTFLGVSEAGLQFETELLLRDVLVDHYGSQMPFDRLYDGETAMVSFRLGYYDAAVLQPLLARLVQPAAAKPPGTLYAVGSPLVQSNLIATTWTFQSPIDNSVLTFPNGFVGNVLSNNINTANKTYDFVVIALPNQNASGVGVVGGIPAAVLFTLQQSSNTG